MNSALCQLFPYVLACNVSIVPVRCTISYGKCDIWNAWLSDVEREFFHPQIHDCNTYILVFGLWKMYGKKYVWNVKRMICFFFHRFGPIKWRCPSNCTKKTVWYGINRPSMIDEVGNHLRNISIKIVFAFFWRVKRGTECTVSLSWTEIRIQQRTDVCDLFCIFLWRIFLAYLTSYGGPKNLLLCKKGYQHQGFAAFFFFLPILN